MKIDLNQKRCEAFGECQKVAPAIYELDDDGNLHVHEPKDGDAAGQEQARAGARACPVAALKIVE